MAKRTNAAPREPASSIVARLVTALNFIEKSTIYYQLLRQKELLDLPEGASRGRSDVVVDRYVLGWTVAAAATYFLSFVTLPLSDIANVIIASAVVVLSAWRVVELASFHLNMLLSRNNRPKGRVATVASFERTFILLLLNYFEVTLWFATWYSIAVREGVLKAPSPLPLSVFRESLAMMLVNTSGLFTPTPSLPLWIAICFQSVVGLFLTVIVLTRTLSMLPPLKEDKLLREKRKNRSSRARNP